jgi:hypothetical protein
MYVCMSHFIGTQVLNQSYFTAMYVTSIQIIIILLVTMNYLTYSTRYFQLWYFTGHSLKIYSALCSSYAFFTHGVAWQQPIHDKVSVRFLPPWHTVWWHLVHSFNLNQAARYFVCPVQAVTWRTVAIIITIVLVFPYFCIRCVSLSSIHYNLAAYILTFRNRAS